MRWPLTIYTDRILADWQGGQARGPLILIRPKYRGDEGIYRHELEHVKQWFFSVGMMSFLYLLSRTWRARYEAAAYREQTCWPDGKGGALTLDAAAARLALPGYDLGLTVEECRILIEGI